MGSSTGTHVGPVLILATLQHREMVLEASFSCTRDTSCEAMRHMLGLWSMPERHKLAQVKAYLKVSLDSKHPLHEKVGRDTRSRLKRGTEWMNEASKTISECCNVAN